MMERGSFSAKLAGLRSGRTQMRNRMECYRSEGKHELAQWYAERIAATEKMIDELQRLATPATTEDK